MKVREAIEHVDEVKPNAFDSKAKVLWLNALEGRIAATSLGDAVKLKGKTEGFEVLTLDKILDQRQEGSH